VSVRLLLIEDNPGDAMIFREKIGASPLDTSLVHVIRLQEALDELAGGVFDLVLVDLSLPDAQGLEAVDRVRKAAPHLPLIVLTGLDDAATAAEAKKRGAVDYLVKWYVDSPSLARYIRYAIEQYRLIGDGGLPLPTTLAARAGVPVSGASRAAAGVEAVAVEVPAVPRVEPEEVPGEVSGEVSGQSVPVGEARVATAALPAVTEHVLVPALEAALDVAARTAALTEHLAGSLRAALELTRREVEGQAARREPLDLLGLAQQAADRGRARAFQRGIPLRVHAERKKVLAVADRHALCDALDRLLAVALASGCGSGVAVVVAPVQGQAIVTATWERCRGIRLTDTDDPLLALDLALSRRLTARAGGAFSLTEEVLEAEVVLAFDAPSHA
jgi:CheY-like chemotaxis protein